MTALAAVATAAYPDADQAGAPVTKVDPDQDLIARVGQGDPAAVRAMVARKLPRLLGVATRMLGDRSEAEDVAQEAFMRLWRQAGRWRPGAALFDTWLHRVTLNLCYDRLRRRREIATDAVPEQTDPAARADQTMIDQARDARLAAAIQSLPERQRAALVLQYYEGLSNIEAAAAMEIGVEALESLLSRARRTLRDRLRGDGNG
jgi:RNA polymerase sigma-70 factor (ECF subfamily)